MKNCFLRLGSSDFTPSAGDGRPVKISHSLRLFSSNTNAAFLIVKILLLLGIIATIGLYVYTFAVPRDVVCDPAEQVKFTGVLRGFQHNRTFYKLTDILLGPQVIPFEIIDKDYLRPMIGHNITLVCCRRVPSQHYKSSYPPEYFDLKSAHINLIEE